MDFKNKVVLITGASSGIGKQTAIEFAKLGSNIILVARRKDKLEQLEKELKKFNVTTLVCECDISKKDQVEIMSKIVIQKFNSVDILVNNAGFAIYGSVSDLSINDIESQMETNYFGMIYCVKNFLPLMIEKKSGHIVNVASVAGKDGNANASAYSVGKAGAIGLTKSLGKELADKNIAVNAITPAGANTRILDQMTKEHVQRMLSKVPRGRFLEVEEFTSLVCWLSSEENTFSTAAVFDISGGRSTY